MSVDAKTACCNCHINVMIWVGLNEILFFIAPLLVTNWVYLIRDKFSFFYLAVQWFLL